MALRFIHTADYMDIIQPDELDIITDADLVVLHNAEAKAINKVKKYIQHKFDVEQIFVPVEDTDVGTEDDTRDITLVEYCIYFTLYILYTRIAKRNVPEDRYEQYKEARDFFKDVQANAISPGWPLIEDEDGEATNPGIRMWSGFSDEYYY